MQMRQLIVPGKVTTLGFCAINHDNETCTNVNLTWFPKKMKNSTMLQLALIAYV